MAPQEAVADDADGQSATVVELTDDAADLTDAGESGLDAAAEQAENDQSGPEVSDADGSDPEATDPEATDPEATDPEAIDPETTDAERTDPQDADGDGAGTDERQATEDDGAGTDTDEPALLTIPMATEEFVVAGLIWDAGAVIPADMHFFIRVLEAQGWTPWHEVGEDETEAATPTDVTGTDPFITGSATAIQVQITGAVTDLPSGLDLHIIPADVSGESADTRSDAGEQAEILPDPQAEAQPIDVEALAEQVVADTAADEARYGASMLAAGSSAGFAPQPASLAPMSTSTVPAPAAVTVQRPAIISRAGWGADEGATFWTPQLSTLRAAVVHHTAGSNNYTRAQSAGIVRGIHRYHTVSNGWGDIGYNFLVDRHGQIFEGRKDSMASPAGRMVVGGHARPMNTNTLGISVMGTYTSTPASSTVLNAMASVIAWQFSRAGVEIGRPTGLISPGSPTRPAGQQLPNIMGHMDVAATACPGRIQGQLPSLRNLVRNRMSLIFHLNNTFSGSADYSFYFGRRDAEVFMGDWNGDGRDTPAIRIGSRFWLTNSNNFTSSVQHFSFGRPTDTILVGDWNGDGRDSFAVRRGTEQRFTYAVGGPVTQIVRGYGRPTDEILVGDWNGDGRDTLGVRRGAQYLLHNRLAVSSPVISFGFGRPTDAVLVGDWNGNGRDTLALRRDATVLFSNSLGPGGVDRRQQFGRITDTGVAGDWNGNGLDRIGVYRAP